MLFQFSLAKTLIDIVSQQTGANRAKSDYLSTITLRLTCPHIFKSVSCFLCMHILHNYQISLYGLDYLHKPIRKYFLKTNRQFSMLLTYNYGVKSLRLNVQSRISAVILREQKFSLITIICCFTHMHIHCSENETFFYATVLVFPATHLNFAFIGEKSM